MLLQSLILQLEPLIKHTPGPYIDHPSLRVQLFYGICYLLPGKKSELKIFANCLFPFCRWRRSSTRAKSAAGSQQPSRINSANSPGNSKAHTSNTTKSTQSEMFLIYGAFWNFSTTQGADPTPKKIQFQRTAVP